MIAQRDLARQFESGEDADFIPDASNVKVVETSKEGYDALLIGFGHAVYAARRDDGTIVYFEGWYGYSPSTSCQLSKMMTGMPKDTVDRRPKRRNFAEADIGVTA